MGQAKRKAAVVPPPPLLKLDLACGQHKQPGFLGVDRIKTEAVDIVHDLTVYPWPFPDASVEEVHCSHYVEHIPLAEDARGVDLLVCFMDELHRILIPGGKATIITPWYASVRAWQDPTHRRPISDVTFCYFNKGWRVSQGLDHYPITADFDFAPSYVMDATIGQRHEDQRAYAMRYFMNAINDLQVVLTKR